ncbi:MAG: hypothetical protein EOM34_09120 [Clostridia bacterium]|nr:hypothetical protein [Lachnospiraceae bacterium]NCC00826.1 hypothetical protein [Clostridia bacterium]NCD02056.1 hypothetical protein [Clostridia bacterium]
MKPVGLYAELVKCDSLDLPSIYDYISDEAYDGKEKIVSYLKNGIEDCVAPGRALDCFNGEVIENKLCGMNDGEFCWQSDLLYYVEKYNLRLEKEFEKKVLSN